MYVFRNNSNSYILIVINSRVVYSEPGTWLTGICNDAMIILSTMELVIITTLSCLNPWIYAWTSSNSNNDGSNTKLDCSTVVEFSDWHG